MSKEVVSISDKSVSFADLEAFITNYLASDPDDIAIQKNKFANNSLFLPIGYIEKKLDEVYMGVWETRNFQTNVVANEITGSIELRVLHPKLHIWLTRTGAASVQIQQTKGSDVTDISAKIKNTLVKDYPHLKSECIKNAAKSLGDAFGRSLNRNEKGEYDLKGEEVDYQLWKDTVDNVGDIEELKKLWKENAEALKTDSYLKKIFNNRKNELL